MNTTIARKGRRRSLLLALLLALVTAGLVTVGAPAAFAGDEPAFGSTEVAAANWIGGGVDVYSNGDTGNVTNDYTAPAVGMKWQCVELTQRLYQAKGWHTGYWTGVTYAYQIYDTASTNGLVAHLNDGSYTPVPGDMIIHDPSASNSAGHVAVVDYVANGKVYVAEQNVATVAESSAGRASYSIGSNGALTRDQSVGLTIRGIVHSPANHNTNGAPSGIQMILDGSGEVWAKTTIGYGSWVPETPTGEKAIAAGSNGMQMLLDGAGQVWAKNDAPSTYWTQETPGGEVAIAAGADGQQMVLDGAGQVWAKSTIGYGSWTPEMPTSIVVTKIAMGDNGLEMVLDNAGQVWTKNSIGYMGGWTQETGPGYTAIAAGDGSLQVVLDGSGVVWARNFPAYFGTWTQETPAGEKAISAGNYGLQMILDSVGEVWAQNGISASWTPESPSGEKLIAAGDANQQMILDGAGEVWAQGTLSMNWTPETPTGEVAIAAGG